MINEKFPYWESYLLSPTDDSKQIAKEIVSNEWVFNKLLEILWLQSYSSQDWSAVSYVQTVVNYFLWVLAFISLIVLIYWFYKILFTTDKFWDSVNQWKKYLRAWIIWIVWIWLSWLIVSFLFYLVKKWL